MKIVEGDLIDMAKRGHFDAIVHGCNCWNTFGAGIALQIRKHFPAAYEADQKTRKGDICKLGHCQYVYCPRVYELPPVTPPICVINAYTQYNPGKDLRYDSLTYCMVDININMAGKTLGMPLIGCGIAGGSWDTVEFIINKELMNVDVTVVKLPEYEFGG